MRRTSLIHTITKFLKTCDREKTLESNQRENYTLHTYIHTYRGTKATNFLLETMPNHKIKQ